VDRLDPRGDRLDRHALALQAPRDRQRDRVGVEVRQRREQLAPSSSSLPTIGGASAVPYSASLIALSRYGSFSSTTRISWSPRANVRNASRSCG
jgi:hypothetical protein